MTELNFEGKMIDESIWCDFDEESDKWVCQNSEGDIVAEVDYIHYRGDFKQKTPVGLLADGSVNIKAQDYPCKKGKWMGSKNLICRRGRK